MMSETISQQVQLINMISPLASQSLTPAYKIHAHTLKYSRNLVILSSEGRGREGEGGRLWQQGTYSVAGH